MAGTVQLMADAAKIKMPSRPALNVNAPENSRAGNSAQRITERVENNKAETTGEIMHLQILGPIGYRSHHLEAICQESVGHKHNYDHVTYLLRGKVRVTYRYEQDGKEVTGEREFEAPDRIYIKADVQHAIKALTEDVLYDCVFSHRDFDGLVTQKYQNARAYQ